MTFTPDPEKMRRYQPSRLAYVEVTAGARKIQAMIIAWQGDMVLICYPPTIIDKLTHGQRETTWNDKTHAVRLRREDSIWAMAEDDHAWHRTQDAKITHRPNPWNIYSQEFPDARE